MSFNDVLGFESSSGLYASTPREDFLNHTWQDKNSIIRIEQLEALCATRCRPAFSTKFATA